MVLWAHAFESALSRIAVSFTPKDLNRASYRDDGHSLLCMLRILPLHDSDGRGNLVPQVSISETILYENGVSLAPRLFPRFDGTRECRQNPSIPLGPKAMKA